MHFNGFDLNLLVALDALLTERNVTRAAARLHITQPAMSNALQRLRQRLDDPILERSGRELKLTPVAEALVRPLQDLLSRTEQLIGLTDGFDPSTATRTFRIAMSDYCAAVFMPLLVQKLSVSAPHIRCEAEALNDQSFERLTARNLDFCVTAQDLFLMGASADGSKVRRADLFRDSYVTATSPEHPAVKHGMDEATYLAYPHVSYRSGSGVRSLEDQAKSTLGLDTKIGAVTSVLVAMPLLVAGTDYIATFPARITQVIGGARGFVLHECPVEIPELVETLLWNTMSDMDRGHVWMRNAIVETAQILQNSKSSEAA
ncbi:LysR family transcriptional regulator [Novosphingobium sp. RL4]|uniref:LysR family transcriptional regulator n=1 Tax=Novosphingobium sp. RL4 TaxID=3109595 RepID=UPI002D786B5E|nr:LysR family transcriptional regulator [Novosphingobium sp. RL4]WRT94431.1 LysR family transcriptional regulator [Novosphingobium sp. RL4]